MEKENKKTNVMAKCNFCDSTATKKVRLYYVEKGNELKEDERSGFEIQPAIYMCNAHDCCVRVMKNDGTDVSYGTLVTVTNSAPIIAWYVFSSSMLTPFPSWVAYLVRPGLSWRTSSPKGVVSTNSLNTFIVMYLLSIVFALKLPTRLSVGLLTLSSLPVSCWVVCGQLYAFCWRFQ
jgi:hypothetical protein